MSLQQNGRRSFTPVQFAPQVLRAKALGLVGSSKIVFRFMRDCKWNKVPLPLKKGFGEVWGAFLLEMPPYVEPAPVWQGPSTRPCAMALGRQTSSSSQQHTRVPSRCGKHQDGVESAAPVAWHRYQRQVCVVSLVGFVMLCISYQPDEKTCVQFTVKLLYFLLSALALVACVLAVAFAAHHYLQLTKFTCGTILESCQCKLDTEDPLSRTFVYQDAADCGSLTSMLSLYLLLQMALNLVAALVCLLTCFVVWKHRYQVFYVGVRFQPLTAAEGHTQQV
uniref:Sarcospan n=1 Tax=Corvus moneduloides TaxID=1196302 RepID=A0A8C3E8Q5_CORMO